MSHRMEVGMPVTGLKMAVVVQVREGVRERVATVMVGWCL